MKISYHKKFTKQYKKLIQKDKNRIIKATQIFSDDLYDKRLKNHPLKGDLIGKHAISAGPDLRIVFEEFDGYILVIFLDLGKHNRVY